MRLLKPSGKGKIKALSGELETAVMEVLWTKGPMKGRDLHGEIRRGREIAYTTALTVLDRLSRKGFIKKDRESGMIVFSAEVTREAYQNGVAGDLVRKAFEVSPDLAVSAFVGLFPRLGPKDVDRLEELIRQRKRNGKPE